MDLGDKIKAARAQKGLTQKELAQRAKLTERTIQRIEKQGVKAIEYASGQKDILYPDGTRVREYPDGRVKKTYPDGRTENSVQSIN